MVRLISMFFLVLLTSCFYFPFTVNALPGMNSKMLVAGIGLIFYIYNQVEGRNGQLNKDTFQLSVHALFVSLISLFSITYNNTSDYVFVTYIISMWVWLGAAYAVYFCIKKVHHGISICLFGNYLIAACLFQCFLALLIDAVLPVKLWVNTFFDSGSVFLNNVDRLYGIGAALDVAGTRFSAVLIIIAAILSRVRESKLIPIYVFAFLFITVVGNMIARTTTIGFLLGLFLLIVETKVFTFRLLSEYNKLWGWMGDILGVGVIYIIYLCSINEGFYHDIRYAFEGFFSLVEKGTWQVSSNEILIGMYVFPETLKTWVVGDGYFANPIFTDPYFTGHVTDGFYMGTDVGYLRYIFYFGVIGLISISAVFCKSAYICISRFPDYRKMFLMILLANFIIWFKVSTDLFPVFAAFLLVAANDEAETRQMSLLAK